MVLMRHSLLLLLFTLLTVLALTFPLTVTAAGNKRTSLSTADFDPDEIDGLPEDGSEIILEDVDEEDTSVTGESKVAAAPTSIWVDPDAPKKAIDPERLAKSLDWIHLHYEVRLPATLGSDSTSQVQGRLLDSTRKLGRDLWQYQLSSGTALPALETAFHDMKIGERRTIPVTWKLEYDELQPKLNTHLQDGQEVVFTFELIRFDLDEKPLSLEDRFWNMLPMLAFFAFMGFRIMRGQEAGAAAAAGAANESAAAGGKKANSSKNKKQR